MHMLESLQGAVEAVTARWVGQRSDVFVFL
jgi:hypothetical protein